jgi:hypothetical protein
MHKHTHTHTHARAHAQTHTHTQTNFDFKQYYMRRADAMHYVDFLIGYFTTLMQAKNLRTHKILKQPQDGQC